jgi:hypothetical protein
MASIPREVGIEERPKFFPAHTVMGLPVDGERLAS